MERKVPGLDRLPWSRQECDAFVIVLDEESLSNDLAAEICGRLVQLPVDWIETMGARCEYLHDRIDEASVTMGRQAKVGDGNPMTAWHEWLSDTDDMISYIRSGGHGSAERKIVVVVGPKHSSAVVAQRIART